MTTKLGKMITYLDRLPHITNSITIIPMVTKLGNVVTYHEELPLITLLDPLITWLCEVTIHIKYFISSLAQDQ